MSTPETGDTMQSQMLLEISKNVGTLVTDVAVIKTQMTQVPDHEIRIRALESAAQQATGGRDTQARVTSWLAAAAAVGAGIAGYLHH